MTKTNEKNTPIFILMNTVGLLHVQTRIIVKSTVFECSKNDIFF